MDGPQHVMESTESVSATTGLDGFAFLTGLTSSGSGLVPASFSEPALAFTLSSLPLTLTGNMTSMSKDQRDLTVSGTDLSLAAQSVLETLARIPDGNFGQNSDPLKSDLGKQMADEKGLSPLNILVSSSSYVDAGQASPAAGPQGGLSGLQYRSAGSGGDTMLSAINYNDSEMLSDSAFDINNSTAPGLAQLDDNFLSGLGNPGSGQGANSFDLFDGGVSDPLSEVSPFGDATLSIDTATLPAMDSERTTDSSMDDPKMSSKSSGNKKNQHKTEKDGDLGSPGKNTPAQCNTCGKQFNNYSALAKHRLTHSDERKYLCTICNKGFKRQDHLNGHQMTHLDKKPYQCPLENCDKGYCDARSLRRHLEAHHRLPTEVAQTHVLTSMAAAGIAPPSQRNGKGRAAEVAAVMAAAAAASKAAASSSAEAGTTNRIINSPSSYSANSTPSPGQASGTQNQFFHMDVPVNKSGGTGGSVAVKVDAAELTKLHKLPESSIRQQNVLHTTAVSSNGEQTPQQVQVQFQAPADIMAMVQQAQQLQLLQQQQQQLLQQQQQQQQQQSPVKAGDTKPVTPQKNPSKKKSKAATDKTVKAAGSVSPLTDGQAADSKNEPSWQERAQVYNFVGTPGSGDQSPASLSGDTSPSVGGQVSPSPSPGAATPTSPLHSPQHPRLNWQPATASHSDKNSEEGKGPIHCTVCDRRFKSLPALNGHMRLHGGYTKKDKEEGKQRRNSTSASPSSTSSSPSTPTDMGPPPPPPPLPPPVQQQQQLPPQPSPQPQPPSPSVQIASGMASPTTLQAPAQSQVAVTLAGGLQVGDVQTALQFYVTSPQQDLQQVGIHPLSAEALQQHQQQLSALQRQLEIQQMAAQLKEEQDMRTLEEQLKLKEEQDIRSLEEQLKQNIHEHNLQQLTSLANPATSQGQTIPISLAQVNEALADVAQTLSPLRTASPHTQQAEHIQRIVEGFQQVEALHRQQQQQQQSAAQTQQLTAQQLELQQQHIQLGLPPLQPAQLQQILQEQQQLQQQQQQQLLQQQQQSPGSVSLAGLQLGQAQLLLQSSQIMQLSGASSVANQAVLNSVASTLSASSSNNPMTPGLPGGVLSNGQQLPLGSNPGSGLGSNPGGTEASNPNPGQHTLMSTTAQNQELLASSISLPLSTPAQQQLVALAQQQLGVPGVSSIDSLPMEIQDPAMSHLIGSMGGFEGSDLLHMSGPNLGGQGLGEALGQQLVSDRLPGFQSFQSLGTSQGSLTPPSSQVSLDSIKQDVMLSSAIHSAPFTLSISSQPSDPPLGGLDPAPPVVSKTSHSELKRRLSADLETGGSKRQNMSSLTHLLNKSPAISSHFVRTVARDTDTATGANSNPNPPPAGGRVRVRSKSGDVHRFMRSKSVDHSLMRPRSSTEESVFRPRQKSGDGTFIGGRSKSHGEDYLSQSDGAGVFRNPSTLPSSFKIKRKHRPSPLFIPPYLSSFQSRLRSPRLWDGGDGKGRGHTPPPYTPPPMLSPIRSGSGLFWTIQSARPLTPQSAPVSARLSFSRKGSHADSISDVAAKDEEESPPPETDIKPHVNIGSQYQADLPVFSGNRLEALKAPSKEDLMWEPSIMETNSEDDVQSFQDFACCAAVRGNGANVEYALHLLYLAKGDIQTAMLMLMGDPPQLPVGHGLLTYKYQETESWSADQIDLYHRALTEYDKDFFSVSKMVGKSVKECIQFYYLWKKVCPDDYKRLRILRRRRHQNTLYNLRSQQPSSGGTEPLQNQQSESTMVTGHEDYESDGSDLEADDQSISATVKSESNQPDLAAEAEISSVASSPVTTAPPSLHGQESMHVRLFGQTVSTPAASNATPTPPPPPVTFPPSPVAVMTGSNPSMTSIAQQVSAPPPQTFSCDFQGCSSTFTSKQSYLRHKRKHLADANEGSTTQTTPRPKPRPSTPSRSPVYDQNGEEIFPCKLCDRVFTKVKSRSAHMKSHKVAEQQDKKAAAAAAAASPAASASPAAFIAPSPNVPTPD